MDKEKIKRIKSSLDSEVGKDLKKFLLGKINYFKNIDNVRDLSDPVAQSVELKAQKKMFLAFVQIMQDILTIEESPDGEDENSEKNDFGV